MDEETFTELIQLLDSMDEETFAELAQDTVNEVMHKLKELQETIQKNKPVLTLIDFACVICMSVMGPVNGANLDEKTDKFPGQMLTRIVVGDITSCKAALIALTNHIKRLDKEKEGRNE